MNPVPLVFRVTGALQVALALDLRGLPERKAFRASQEDLEVLVHLELKVNRV